MSGEEIWELVGRNGVKVTPDEANQFAYVELGDFFESVCKNLKSYPYVLNRTDGVLTSIVYTVDGNTITKTLGYTGGLLTTVTLSGATPSGIALVKTLNYTDGVLTSVSYSGGS